MIAAFFEENNRECSDPEKIESIKKAFYAIRGLYYSIFHVCVNTLFFVIVIKCFDYFRGIFLICS